MTLTRRGYAYGGTTPAGSPRKYWTYGFLRWLDGIHPADDGGIRALAALRNEVEAADETRGGCSNGSGGSGVGNSGDNGVGLLDLNLVVFAV